MKTGLLLRKLGIASALICGNLIAQNGLKLMQAEHANHAAEVTGFSSFEARIRNSMAVSDSTFGRSLDPLLKKDFAADVEAREKLDQRKQALSETIRKHNRLADTLRLLVEQEEKILASLKDREPGRKQEQQWKDYQTMYINRSAGALTVRTQADEELQALYDVCVELLLKYGKKGKYN